MALIETAIPSLINGVSQQSPRLRRTSQCEEQVNALADPVKGLRPRYPSIVIARLPSEGLDPVNITSHLINRDEDERFKLLISDETIKVIDIQTGEEKPVTLDASTSYLASTQSKKDLRFLTIADTTFIVNSKRTVLPKEATYIADTDSTALFYIRKGDYSTRYEMYTNINNLQRSARYTSPAPTTTGSNNIQNREAISTITISENLFNSYLSKVYDIRGTPDESTTETVNGITQTRQTWNDLERPFEQKFSIIRGEVFLAVRNDESGVDFSAEASDSLANTGLKLAFRKVNKLSDLPDKALQDFVIKVDGQEVETGDEYYVQFKYNSWEEVAKSDEGIAEETAPHALIKQPDGSFLFTTLNWNRRRAGDTSTNPLPSFVNQQISDVFYFKDRLGFVSDENIILSEVGEPYNFFRTTMLQLLDSDPIDVSMNDDQIAQLRYALPFDNELIVFSDNAQFSVGGEGLLSPSTISSDVTTRFEMDINVKPKGIGRAMFFAQPYGDSGKVLEYYVDTDANVKDATDITAHCPHYIQGKIRRMTASTTNNMLAVLTQDKLDSIYIYHFFWQGNEKVQSSWSRWEFPNFKVISCDFLENKLHILFYHDETDSYYLEFIDITNAYLDKQTEAFIDDIRLDHLELHNTSSTLNSTPLANTSDWQIVAKDNTVYQNTSQVPTQVGMTYHTGYPLNFSYTFSQFVVPSPSRGQDVTALRGRLQVKNILIHYLDTAKFSIEVAIEDRPIKTKTYDSRIVSSGNVVFNDISRTQGQFSVPVKAEASKVKITIKNSSYLPSSFHGLEWEGWFHQRARRI